MKTMHQRDSTGNKGGFTLAEVVIALAIAAMLMAGISLGFVQSARQAEWSAYNLAAQSLALQGIEQARSAKWDPQAIVPVDNCTSTNFPTTTTNLLDVPISGTNGQTYATNTWTITLVSTNPYPLKMIRVDTTWEFVRSSGPSRVFTNTVATLRAPDE
jgi:prepilin-type N-terminal cleavage/methylation domain-containing protein